MKNQIIIIFACLTLCACGGGGSGGEESTDINTTTSQPPIPRFEVISTDSAIDNITDFRWDRNGSWVILGSQTLTWHEANNYCTSMGAGWRLPDTYEFTELGRDPFTGVVTGDYEEALEIGIFKDPRRLNHIVFLWANDPPILNAYGTESAVCNIFEGGKSFVRLSSANCGGSNPLNLHAMCVNTTSP